MLIVRCKACNKEIVSHNTQSKSCGCDNMTVVKGDTISAVDLTKVVMVYSDKENKNSSVLSSQDLEFQEERKKRKVSRKLLDSIDIR